MCEFKDEEGQIRDKLVFGVRDERTKERLLREGDQLTAQKIMDICHAAEASRMQIEGMRAGAATASAKQVNAVST